MKIGSFKLKDCEIIKSQPKPSPSNHCAAGKIPQPTAGMKDILAQESIGETKAQTHVDLFQDNCSDGACRNFYVNGIRTSEANAQEAVEALKKNLDTNVELIYNPSDGVLSDGLEAIMNLSGINTEISRETAKKLGAAIETGESIRVFAHSQGAAITADALNKLAKQYKQRAMTPDQIQAKFSQVEVVSFGGFATEEVFPKGVKVQLLNKKTDFIPQFAQRYQELVHAFKSEDQDVGQAFKNTGKTLASFVAVNTAQLVSFGIGKGIHAAAHDFYGKNFKDGASNYLESVIAAVRSDHSATIKDKFVGEITKGYIEEFRFKYAK